MILVVLGFGSCVFFDSCNFVVGEVGIFFDDDMLGLFVFGLVELVDL